ncbi:MAG: 23S rRNA (pseudouridine(1915)-N(3))-methyltransferase RlmH [Silicimonas sp.]|nr:23S rRNA (pseudouridine(1915)-N(3))-methyltransferase RlmH [Silicimonas sp.]
MDLKILAVGRLRAGPEATLIDDYLSRIGKIGRPVGIGAATVQEVEAKKGGMGAEAQLLEKAAKGAAPLITLDERGKLLSSPDFAGKIEAWRDDGAPAATFIIGGADGIDPALRARADFSISFGKMVWPHMLVRVMLAEQLYRATSILTGSPYHRV